MSSYFFDSSALAKRYHQESGSSWVHAICDPRTHPPIYIAQLAHIEVVAALRRTGRREGLHRSFIDAIVNIFERHVAASATQHSPIYHIAPLLPGIREPGCSSLQQILDS